MFSGLSHVVGRVSTSLLSATAVRRDPFYLYSVTPRHVQLPRPGQTQALWSGGPESEPLGCQGISYLSIPNWLGCRLFLPHVNSGAMNIPGQVSV